MNIPLMFINNILSNVYVYQSWENLNTRGVSSRSGVCLPYIKKGDKEDIENSRPISFIIKCNNISASKY